MRNFVATRGESSIVENALRIQLLVEVGSALCYLHSRRPAAVVHGDIKDSNIFVQVLPGDNIQAKLLDFGLSRLVTRNARPMGGTVRWMAPELFHGDRSPNVATDVFSFGRVVYMVSTGRVPFGERRGLDDLLRLMRRSPSVRWPPLKDRKFMLASLCKPVAEQCTHSNPVLRSSMNDVFTNLKEVEKSLVIEEQQETDMSTGALPPLPEGGPGSSSTKSSSGADTSTQDASNRGRRLVQPSYAETPDETLRKALGLMMMQWNYDLGPRGCCWLHSGLHLLRRLRQELASLPCESEVPPVCGQCEGCGLLTLDDCTKAHRCGLCDAAFVEAA